MKQACSCGNFWKEAGAEQDYFLRFQGSVELVDGLLLLWMCRGMVLGTAVDV